MKKDNIIRNMKGVISFVLIFGGFLLMCSETLPGEEGNAWALVAQEAVGLGILGLGFIIASKIEKR